MPPKPKGKTSLGSDAQVPSTSNGGQTGANIPPRRGRKSSFPSQKVKKEPLRAVSGSGSAVQPEDLELQRQVKDAFRLYLQQGVLKMIGQKIGQQYAQAESLEAKEAVLKSEVAMRFNRIAESYPVKQYNIMMIQQLVDTDSILSVYQDFIKIYSTVAKDDSPMMVLQFVLEHKFSGISHDAIVQAQRQSPLNVEEEKVAMKKLVTNLQRHLIPQIDTSKSSLLLLKAFTEAVKELIPLLEKARSLRVDSENLSKTLEEWQSLQASSTAFQRHSSSLTLEEENEVKVAALEAIFDKRGKDFLSSGDSAQTNKKAK